MSEKISEKDDTPEELTLAEKLFNEGKDDEALKIVNDFEKSGNLTPTSQNRSLLLKSVYLWKVRRLRDSIELAEKAYKESLKLNNNKQSIESLLSLVRSLLMLGELDKGFEKLEVCEGILQKIMGKPQEIKRLKALLNRLFGVFYVFKGDIRQALIYEEKALTLAQEVGDKGLICILHNNLGERYRNLGDLNRALEYAQRGLVLHEEYFNYGNTMTLAYLLTTLIDICMDKNNLKKAQNYLLRLEQLNHYEDNKVIDQLYRSLKATILKSTPRARNRVLAEDLFRQIVEEEISTFEIWARALINLCDLLLVELQMTNIVEIVDEIRPLIEKLLEIAEDKHSNWLIAEAYILKAKLSILTFDIKKAQRFLIQAQQIAERFGLQLLAIRISNEHDELLKQLNIWENLEESSVSLKERMEFARVNEQMDNMIRKRAIGAPQLSDEEPVLLLIVSEGGKPIFSQSFEENHSFEDYLFGGFFTTINSFISEKFSVGLDRASFGEHTLLMHSISPFFMCYVFKGQSYLAQRRIRYFTDKIQNDEDIWQNFKKFYKLNKEIQLKDIPSLEPLINEIFINKTIPLN